MPVSRGGGSGGGRSSGSGRPSGGTFRTDPNRHNNNTSGGSNGSGAIGLATMAGIIGAGIWASGGEPSKLENTDQYFTGYYYEDHLGRVRDPETLVKSFQEFRNRTGILPYFMTDCSEKWMPQNSWNKHTNGSGGKVNLVDMLKDQLFGSANSQNNKFNAATKFGMNNQDNVQVNYQNAQAATNEPSNASAVQKSMFKLKDGVAPNPNNPLNAQPNAANTANTANAANAANSDIPTYENQAEIDALYDYAYDQYLKRFKGESHYMILYTEQCKYSDPRDVEWYWIEMAGDRTVRIFNNSAFQKFQADFQRYLEDPKINVEQAIVRAIDNTSAYILPPKQENSENKGQETK